MADLAGLARRRIASADAVDSVTEAANIHELEPEREKERAEHEPSDDDRDLDQVAIRVVPEGDIVKNGPADGVHDPGREEGLGH